MRPSLFQVGGTLYWTILIRDPDTMLLKDADSTPTVAVKKNGAAVGDSVTVTKRSATTGIYDCSYNPAAEVEGDAFTIEEAATVTGTTTSSATYNFNWSVRTVRTGAVELDSASIAAIVEKQLTESYATDGSAPTLEQALMMLLQHHQEKSVSGTTVTIKKLDKSTTASTYTLDSATDPTSITRAS